MNASMEQIVSSALMRWRFVERALHSQGVWTASCNGVTVPAQRIIEDTCVSIVARFPAQDDLCVLDPSLIVTLMEDGEVVKMVALDAPLDETGADFRYSVSLADPVRA